MRIIGKGAGPGLAWPRKKASTFGGGSPRPHAPGGGGAHSAGCEHRLRHHAHSVCISCRALVRAGLFGLVPQHLDISTTIKGTRPLLPRAAPLEGRACPWPCERSRLPRMPIVKLRPAFLIGIMLVAYARSLTDESFLCQVTGKDQLQTRWQLVRAHGPEREPS